MVLAAIVKHEVSQFSKVLDVGTGTGAIALMLAQEYSMIAVDGIEVDELATLEACFNFSQSPFSKKLRVINNDFFSHTFCEEYDLVVSNPPFYQNTLLGEDERVNVAKHANEFPFSSFYEKVYLLTTDQGTLVLIIPNEDMEWHSSVWEMKGWKCRLNYQVFSKEGCLKRNVVFLIKQETELNTVDFVIRNSDNSYTKQYIHFTKTFHNKEL